MSLFWWTGGPLGDSSNTTAPLVGAKQERMTKRLHFQIPDEYFAKAEKRAQKEHRAVGNWIASLVIAKLDEDTA